MKNRNLITALIVLLIIAITATVALADEGTPGIQFTNVLVNGVDIYNIGSTVTVKPMQTVTVSFKVKNLLDEPVTKITSQVMDTDINGDGYHFMMNEQIQFHLPAGQESQTQTIKFTIPADVPTKDHYFLKLMAEGYTLDDSVQRAKYDFYFAVKREKAEIVLSVDPLEAGKETLTCSETTTLKGKIINTGSVTEDDVILRVMDGSTEIYNSAKANVDLTVMPGETKTVEIPVTLTSVGQHSLSVEAGFNYINNIPASTAEPKSVKLTKKACLSDSVTPTQKELTVLDGTSVDFAVSASEANYENSIAWSIDGAEVAKGKTLSYTFSKAGTFVVKATLNQEVKTWKVMVADKPLDLTAFGLTQSDIDLISANPASVKNLVLSTADGKIAFTEAVDLSSIAYLADVVKIGKQFVAVDSVKAAGLNKPATVTMKNVGTGQATLYKYGGFADASIVDKAQVCTSETCTLISYTNGEYTISVIGFSTYIVVVQKEADLSVPTEIVLEDSKTNSTISASFAVQNSGSVGAIKNVSFDLTGIGSAYKAKVTGAPTELAPLESKTVTLEITPDKDADSGKKQIGAVKITSSKGTRTIPVYVNTKSFLAIEEVKVNDKTTGEWSLDEVNTVTVTVRNDYSDDMEDVSVTAKILDINNDDLEETADSFTLNNDGDDDKVTISFDLRNEDVDKKEYTLEITVVGKAKDKTRHETTTTKIVNVDVAEHKIIISKTSLAADALSCGQQYMTLDVTIKNVGNNNEDNIEVKVKNSALGIDMNKNNIELDKLGDSNNDKALTFTLNTEKAAAGSYPLTIEVYRDGKLQESSTVTLTVKSCAATGATVLGTSNTGAVGQDTLTKQLQEQLNARLGEQPVVKTSLRDSNSYVLLLGGLVALVFIAFVLAMALIWKKK